jgi:hypothetical protein
LHSVEGVPRFQFREEPTSAVASRGLVGGARGVVAAREVAIFALLRLSRFPVVG